MPSTRGSEVVRKADERVELSLSQLSIGYIPPDRSLRFVHASDKLSVHVGWRDFPFEFFLSTWAMVSERTYPKGAVMCSVIVVVHRDVFAYAQGR